MSLYRELAIVFVISIALSALYTWTETPSSYDQDAEQNGYRYLSFSATFLALLLSFTVTIVWQSYNQFKTLIFNQVAEIKDFFYSIKGLPNSKPIIIELEKYLTSVIEDQWPSSKAGHINPKSLALNRSLLDMIREYNLNHPQLSKLLKLNVNLSHQLDELIPDSVDSYLVLVITIISIVFLILLWFIRFKNIRTQLIFNLGTIFIIGLALYFLVVLSQPFHSHAFTIKPTGYIELRDEIRNYLQGTSS